MTTHMHFKMTDLFLHRCIVSSDTNLPCMTLLFQCQALNPAHIEIDTQTKPSDKHFAFPERLFAPLQQEAAATIFFFF